jgi:lipopolysaccharide/colanic/teichoic acid biosynthesis glycosyltransferase
MKMNTYELVKRILNFLLALIMLIIMAPLMVIVAILIKLDSAGPIVYKQKRLGKDGEHIYIYKFRTMKTNLFNDKLNKYIEGLLTGPEQRDSTWYLHNDPRITPIGYLLRKYSLDTLPQLFNVIKGDMNIVGPRPVLDYELQHYQDWHYERFKTLPGIVGLSTVLSPSSADLDEVLQKELEYVHEKSLILDLKILFKTVGIIIKGKGAY